MVKALFITGNKRSGTSQLVRLLNLHPQVFVSHESDVIWILYQFRQYKPFVSYPQDSPKGMEDALKKCGHLLDHKKTPAENFFAFENCLMEKGTPWLPSMRKIDLLWVGDKKPFQYADPDLAEFILDNFSEACFIHIIRHPFSVAVSSEAFNKTPDGDFWNGLTLEEVVEKWTENEKKVLGLKQDKRVKILDIRYEDLCQDAGKELKRVFDFLGLDVNENILKKASKETLYTEKNIPKIQCSQETRSIMKQYGYEADGVTRNPLELAFRNIYWKLKKKIR